MTHAEEIEHALECHLQEQEEIRDLVAANKEATRDAFKAPNPAQVKATFYFGGVTADGARIDWLSIVDYLPSLLTPFDGFSYEQIQGVWKGEREPCCRVTLCADDTPAFRQQCRTIAERYNTRYNQQATLVTFEACDYALVQWPNHPDKYRNHDYQ